jgi:hypothetical protein
VLQADTGHLPAPSALTANVLAFPDLREERSPAAHGISAPPVRQIEAPQHRRISGLALGLLLLPGTMLLMEVIRRLIEAA